MPCHLYVLQQFFSSYIDSRVSLLDLKFLIAVIPVCNFTNNNSGFLYSAFFHILGHAQSASRIITPAGLCHSTYILFLSLHSGEYSPK